MKSFGFIILRHVNNEITNQYWISCIKSIREYYPENKIIIIDDNSNYEYITENEFSNTITIQSEYPKRGELLPYYYYVKNNFFDIAIILHDSIIINKPIENIKEIETYRFLWDFEHDWDHTNDERRLINLFNDYELKTFYENKHLWKGCFGCMTIINYDFLNFINKKYDISILLNNIINRYSRCSFERVLACLLQKENKQKAIFGDIHIYCNSKVRFDEIEKYRYLPIIKYWTGR
jgi:hypothetical protein